MIRYFTKADQVVLDAGGGEGYVAAHLLELYGKDRPTVLCYDLSDQLLADGDRRYKEKTLFFLAGDVMHMALKENSIDVSLCIEAVEHIRDLENFAKEMLRVLKPGGRIYISTPNKNSLNLKFNDRGMYFIYNGLVKVWNIFAKNKKELYEILPYGYEESENGYECYLTAGQLHSYFEKVGFKLYRRYFTEWAGEAIFAICRGLKIPAWVLKPGVWLIEKKEIIFRGLAFAELIGFTQIAVFEKPKD